MQPYKITHKYGLYYGKWKDITVEAQTAHEAIVCIMKKIKEVLWNYHY